MRKVRFYNDWPYISIASQLFNISIEIANIALFQIDVTRYEFYLSLLGFGLRFEIEAVWRKLSELHLRLGKHLR